MCRRFYADISAYAEISAYALIVGSLYGRARLRVCYIRGNLQAMRGRSLNQFFRGISYLPNR